ncbi:uncharacterized protein LOC117330986 [Pecten maximus]|uniref:uncharacterized protein LOC117330986 n=1 Tax=Pecten maximus TaxID=6579 RepID=UPI0014584636|nr:uncharacterized protein LOC117330986 [Pecten maximus]
MRSLTSYTTGPYFFVITKGHQIRKVSNGHALTDLVHDRAVFLCYYKRTLPNRQKRWRLSYIRAGPSSLEGGPGSHILKTYWSLEAALMDTGFGGPALVDSGFDHTIFVHGFTDVPYNIGGGVGIDNIDPNGFNLLCIEEAFEEARLRQIRYKQE